jgi:uncharacterized protein YbjT (DUF2867 family)
MDGAAGLEAVKAAGGVAFAQDPTTAGIPVRALTRNPDKPEARALVGHGTAVVRGDLNDPISLTRALEAVDSVYSVQASTGGPEAELREGVNLISAAARQRLSLFAYSSVGSADQNTGIPHFDSKAQIEERLRRSGLPWVILRPVFFMENWLGMRQAIDGGMLALPLKPETRLQMIAVDDIGIVAAKAFQHPGHWRGRTMELAGDELAMTELVSALERMAGREVLYQQVPWDQWEEQVGPDLARMWRWFEEVGYHADIAAARSEHPILMSFERWLKNHWVRAFTA